MMATRGRVALDAGTRKANRRLAVVLGAVALAFYLLMLFFNPQ